MTICLKVILQTRDIACWGFPDSLLQYGCYIKTVIVLQWFFLQTTQRASLYYFSECDFCHILSAAIICLTCKNFKNFQTFAGYTSRNNGLKFCTKRDLFAYRQVDLFLIFHSTSVALNILNHDQLFSDFENFMSWF